MKCWWWCRPYLTLRSVSTCLPSLRVRTTHRLVKRDFIIPTNTTDCLPLSKVQLSKVVIAVIWELRTLCIFIAWRLHLSGLNLCLHSSVCCSCLWTPNTGNTILLFSVCYYQLLNLYILFRKSQERTRLVLSVDKDLLALGSRPAQERDPNQIILLKKIAATKSSLSGRLVQWQLQPRRGDVLKNKIS